MTAEIAILNRTAVALAADSVVTLSNHRGRKTYDSAEKIFQLSRHQPIGLMIYNNAQHVNAPLEVVVRSFRAGLGTSAFDRLLDVWPAFSKFLIEFPHTEQDEFDHFSRMVALELDKLSVVQFNFMLETVVNKRRPQGERSADRVRKAVAERRAEADAAILEGYLSEKSEEEFVDRYGPTIDKIANRALNVTELDADLRRDLYGLFFALVRSSLPTDAFTG